MEETIGKRIAANRKKLGLTQDALAEQLGVTAQAVSKWENDQSCPDIATLPRLAEIFSCTTDSLLGLEEKNIHIQTPEAKPGDTQPDESHTCSDDREFQWDGGRRHGVGIALWLVIAGILSLASALCGWDTDTWHILWSSGIMVLGFIGVLRGFSVLRLGVFLSGAYFLLWHIGVLPAELTILRWDVMIPGTLLLLGLCLLADSLRKPRSRVFRISKNGHGYPKSGSRFTCGDDAFDCATVFGENHHLITLSLLKKGCADLSFGELEVDLRGCEAFDSDCSIDVSCAFGELVLTLPKHCRVRPNISTAFAVLDVEGAPAADAFAEIYVNGCARFGAITVRYL